LGSNHDFVELIGNWESVETEEGKTRDDDKIDFAFLELGVTILSQLGNLKFISNNEVLNRDLKKHEIYCSVFGYPHSKNKIKNIPKKKVKPIPFNFSSILNFEETIFEKYSYSMDSHFLLEFDHKRSKNSNGETVNSISPRGVSGGGLFLIEGMEDTSSYNFMNVPTFKLLGILIENQKHDRVLAFTKINLILGAIHQYIRSG